MTDNNIIKDNNYDWIRIKSANSIKSEKNNNNISFESLESPTEIKFFSPK